MSKSVELRQKRSELWEKANGNKDFSIRNYIYGISGKILYTVKGLNKEYIYSFGQTY